MTAGWHVGEPVGACYRLADALDYAADYIADRNAIAAAELTGLADAYASGQAAHLATGELTESAVSPVVAAARAVTETLTRDIAEYAVSHVMGAAFRDLTSTVADAMTGLDWSRAASAGARSHGFELHREPVEAHAAALRRHADSFRAHVTAFQAMIRALEFEIPASSAANSFRSLVDDASEALGALGQAQRIR